MRPTLFATAGLLGLFVGAAPACDPKAGDACPAGTEGCHCTADWDCLEGLTCLSEYCVDPEPDADEDEDEDEEQDDESPADDGGSSTDNVGACETWIDAAECGDYDWSQSVDCSLYADLQCDIADYFDCLTDNTACSGGIPDTSGWAACVELAACS
jgi:hypothetical protein